MSKSLFIFMYKLLVMYIFNFNILENYSHLYFVLNGNG